MEVSSNSSDAYRAPGDRRPEAQSSMTGITRTNLDGSQRCSANGDVAAGPVCTDIAMHQFRRKEGSGTIASTADSPKDDKTAATIRSYAAVSAWLALAWAAVASAGAVVGRTWQRQPRWRRHCLPRPALPRGPQLRMTQRREWARRRGSARWARLRDARMRTSGEVERVAV